MLLHAFLQCFVKIVKSLDHQSSVLKLRSFSFGSSDGWRAKGRDKTSETVKQHNRGIQHHQPFLYHMLQYLLQHITTKILVRLMSPLCVLLKVVCLYLLLFIFFLIPLEKGFVSDFLLGKFVRADGQQWRGDGSDDQGVLEYRLLKAEKKTINVGVLWESITGRGSSHSLVCLRTYLVCEIWHAQDLDCHCLDLCLGRHMRF